MADVTGPISVILPNMAGGGVERVRLLLAQEFRARGFNVEFVLMNASGPLLSELPAGVSVVDLGCRRVREVLWPLRRYIRKAAPAAVLAAMWPLSGVSAVACRLAGFGGRVVVSEHMHLSASPTMQGARGTVHRLVGRSVYRCATSVVAVSSGVRDDLLARTGLPPGSVEVIHNPVRFPVKANGDEQDAIARPWSGHSGPRIIAVGTLKRQKDFALLLTAFAQVRRQTGARLLILGEGPLRAELEGLRHRLNLDGAVDMPGFVPDPYPYLGKADLFVLSSAAEGFGNVIVEALACGTPVVSTDCPSGPREILEHGRHGTLVPVGDADALASAILAALAADHNRPALIRRAQEFSVEKAADAYLKLLLRESHEHPLSLLH